MRKAALLILFALAILLAVTVVGFDGMACVMRYPQISIVRLDIHLTAATPELVHHKFRILQ